MHGKLKRIKEFFHPQDQRVIVRQSFYTFSKEYPAGKIAISRRRRKADKKGRFLRFLAAAVCFLFLVCVAFFFTDLAFRFSNRAIEADTPAAVRAMPDLTRLRALALQPEAISGKERVKKAIKQLRRQDCNTVVLDFKTQDGRLLYSSGEAMAVASKCSIYNNETVRDALKQFHAAGFNVIARVYCFEDARIAAANPDLAAKYLNTQVPWLDDLEENGGKPWLNPYNREARTYIKNLLSEICVFDVQGVLMQSVCFPAGEDPASATFPGEELSVDRSTLLQNFIASLKKLLPENRCLLIGADAQDLQNGSDARYAGEPIFDSADGVVCDTAIRPEGYTLTKKDHFSSVISLYNAIRNKAGTGVLILEIPKEEVSGSYLRALRRSGLRAVILNWIFHIET